MGERVVSVTIRLESDADDATLMQDVESAVWDALTELTNVGRIDEASHVDVEVE